jgi:hypothetical protein
MYYDIVHTNCFSHVSRANLLYHEAYKIANVVWLLSQTLTRTAYMAEDSTQLEFLDMYGT